METDWFRMRDARLHLNSYTHPHVPVFVAAASSPAGPMAAGKHGIGMLSFASVTPESEKSLRRTWEWYGDAAAKSGHEASRENWRLGVSFHLADSREEADPRRARGVRARALELLQRDACGRGAVGRWVVGPSRRRSKVAG